MNDSEHQFLITTLLNKHKEDIEMDSVYSAQKFFDRKGRPLNVKEWKVLISYPQYYEIKEGTLHNLEVSCYWIGVDNHLFETGIFTLEGLIFHYERSMNEQDALRNYEKMMFWIDQKIVTKKNLIPKGLY